ncbi:MAG: S-layer homology domain-containing protein, partial [Oscillospiraceae bacterium]
NDMSDSLFEVAALGIIKGDDDGNFKLEEKVTRAEFATIVIRLMDLGNITGNRDTKFTDVKKEDWFSGDVATVTEMGIMNGISETEFAPNDTVTCEEVMKTMVVILGYGYIANEKGGYPNGHNTVARSLKLYDNLNIGENFTRGDLVTVIYNSLDVNMLVKSFNTSEIEYEIKEGETLRVRLTQGNHEIYKSRGIIMANEWTWLDVPISDLESDEVIIDNIVYKVGNTDAKNYIGIEVDFFAEKNKITDEFMLKAIKATKKNTKTTIDSRDITEITQNEISYSKKDKIVKLRIDEQPKVVKNGMLLKVYQIENLKPKNGTMTVIDNNGDSRVDIISIEEYVNVKVERIQNDTIFLYNGYKFGKNAFIKIDKNDNDRKYIIENKKGEALEISDIKADSIISIISDEEKTRMKLKVSDEIVEGDITSIFKDKATINDV